MSALSTDPGAPDAEQAAKLLLRDLRTGEHGLSSAEAARRLAQYGANELQRRGGARWPGELARQLTHPLALLLWLAAGLSLLVGSGTVAIAVLLVILLNASFAFVQELQAERAVEALAAYMPQHATALRDGGPVQVEATTLVPGDIVLLEEGNRIAADMRLLSGAVEVNLSTLNGESEPALRSAALQDTDVPRLAARDLVFSGTTVTGGEARAVVFATAMHTELGRIAALSERVDEEPSPLERQVRRVAWLIAAVAVALAIGFIPLAIFGAGLSVKHSVVFAVGLLAGNVPEGLLPVITLALAVSVGLLARRGALVKRLSSVETLGCTDVICTDKTGTLTENRMRPLAAWTLAGETALPEHGQLTTEHSPALVALARCASACNQARLSDAGQSSGDPTELALLSAARTLGADISSQAREAGRRRVYQFDPALKLMSTIDRLGGQLIAHTKGAPEALLPRCASALSPDGATVALGAPERATIARQVEDYARAGLRVLALAKRPAPSEQEPRAQIESELCFLGLVTMLDPPREGVAQAVERCHSAGIRIIVITGDHPLTAAAIAHRVGIGSERAQVLDAQGFEHGHEREIADAVASGDELIFARAAPETKLQIAEALRAQGHVVAMTGDGVNDAPALRSADIGVAMGRSGTDVAREAATMILTDDNFATIVAAIEAGRRVYENVRKFILYIFAHATPEVIPFLVYALSGGSIPLPLPVLLLLAFDVGTETLPSLALGRDPAEPGIMRRPPRKRSESVIGRPMLLRAWLFLGVLLSLLSLACFFVVLTGAGWHPGDSVLASSRFHHAYLQATTMTFLAMIAGQIGTAFAVRTQSGSPSELGLLSNRYLLLGIAAEIALAGAIVYAPPLQSLLGSAAPPARDLLLLLPCPLIVWGADRVRGGLACRLQSNQTLAAPKLGARA
ncbi:MAG TPA: cation-transporting P-type ATPase [Solirubrobacteraceae bacterium]|nr:cation-transporting P-type ATPase [Solirubrobacteraceae bacterium]